MSRVTNVILTTGAGEIHIDALNALWDFQGCQEFSDNALTCAGCKQMECNVYLGAFNHFDLPSFIETVKKVDWMFKTEVQLFVEEDNETRFREVGLWEREG